MINKDILSKEYNGKKLSDMNKTEFVQYMAACMTDIASISTSDKTYADNLNNINDIIALRKTFNNTEAEKLNAIEKIQYIGKNSPTKSKTLDELLS